MKIVIDMNLSPEWVPNLTALGHDVRHWSSIGAAWAEDSEIMEWADQNGFVVFTNDLDFGNLLAASGAGQPSVIQVRTLGLLPRQIGNLVADALSQFATVLASGALVTINERRSKATVLPLIR